MSTTKRALVAHLHDDVAVVAGEQVDVVADAPHVHLAIARCRVDGAARRRGAPLDGRILARPFASVSVEMRVANSGWDVSGPPR